MVGKQFVHEALFYRNSGEYVAGAHTFIREGLDAGEPVLVAVPADHLALLRQDGLADCAAGVRWLDMRTAGRNPGRILPTVLLTFVAEHPGTRVRIIGEPIWPGRTPTEYASCVQHEALINVALADACATVLCPYNMGRLHPAVLADAERTHPVLVCGGQRGASARYTEPAELIKLFNRPLTAPATPPVEVVFHADGLSDVRKLAADRAGRAGLSADRIAAFQLAVNEIATNVIEHTDGPGTMRIWPERDRIICEIRDSGQLTDRLAGRRAPDPAAKRGRGLLLVNYVCDLVETYTHPTGTTIRLHMELAPVAQGAS